MKQTFNQWAYEQVQVKGNQIKAVKGEPPYEMFCSDGARIERINLKWVNTTDGEEFICDYDRERQENLNQ